MIQPLRTAHRRIFIALGAILPAVIAAGLSVRPRFEIKTGTESGILPNAARSRSVVSQKQTFSVQFYSDGGNPIAVHLVVQPLRELIDPDLLLYWTEGTEPMSVDMSRAQLLGPFASVSSFAIRTGQQKVFLVLYSLAHRAIVDSAHIERLP